MSIESITNGLQHQLSTQLLVNLTIDKVANNFDSPIVTTTLCARHSSLFLSSNFSCIQNMIHPQGSTLPNPNEQPYPRCFKTKLFSSELALAHCIPLNHHSIQSGQSPFALKKCEIKVFDIATPIKGASCNHFERSNLLSHICSDRATICLFIRFRPHTPTDNPQGAAGSPTIVRIDPAIAFDFNYYYCY
jgi:hypothetical protein